MTLVFPYVLEEFYFLNRPQKRPQRSQNLCYKNRDPINKATILVQGMDYPTLCFTYLRCIAHAQEQSQCCGSMLVSDTRDGRFELFCCNDKYFYHWIKQIQGKHLAKIQIKLLLSLKLCLFSHQSHQNSQNSFIDINEKKKVWWWNDELFVFPPTPNETKVCVIIEERKHSLSVTLCKTYVL